VAESEDKGRCINCGFLAKHATGKDRRGPTPAYFEIEVSDRDSGQVWSHVAEHGMGEIQTEPMCFRRAAAIREEIDNNIKGGDARDARAAAKEICSKDRNCRSWYGYIPGLSPKDHFDQMNMQLLENSRREWEMRLETERKDFDLKLFEASQKIQENNRQIAADSYKTARRSFWFTLFSTIVIGLLTLITLFLTLLQVWLAMRQSGVPIPFPEWFNWLGLKSLGG
jgi:hypothetical protein